LNLKGIAMTFTPKTDKELAMDMVWDAGVYDFEVIKAEHCTSKAGNAMLAIELLVFHGDGRKQKVSDWLVAVDHALCLMKLRHYCRTTGNMPAYESGDLANFPGAGAAGEVRLVVEDDPKYGPRNRVKDYISEEADPAKKPKSKKKKDASPVAQNPVNNAMMENEDIPF